MCIELKWWEHLSRNGRVWINTESSKGNESCHNDYSSQINSEFSCNVYKSIDRELFGKSNPYKTWSYDMVSLKKRGISNLAGLHRGTQRPCNTQQKQFCGAGQCKLVKAQLKKKRHQDYGVQFQGSVDLEIKINIRKKKGLLRWKERKWKWIQD